MKIGTHKMGKVDERKCRHCGNEFEPIRISQTSCNDCERRTDYRPDIFNS